LWEELRALVEPLVKAEDTTQEVPTTGKLRCYEEAIRMCARVRSFDVGRDYFYESMLMDAKSLDGALSVAANLLRREAQRRELLDSMANARTVVVVEQAMRTAGSVKDAVEMQAAARMVQLFHELDKAKDKSEKKEAEAKASKKESKSLGERVVEMEQQLGNDAATIMDLRNKLAEAKRDRKVALEKERKLLNSVRESLAALERENESLKGEIALLKDDLGVHKDLHKEISKLEEEADTARQRQRRAEEETERYRQEASGERETRRRLDRHLMETEGHVQNLKGDIKELEEKKAAVEDLLDLARMDLKHEKTWREEWNEVHNEVRDAVARLYTADAPAVIDERSHQIMAILQERIRSEGFLRSRVAELEDQVARESAERINYERRLAEAQQEMVEVRVRAAKAGLGGYDDREADSYRHESRAITLEVGRDGGAPSLIPKPAAVGGRGGNTAASRAGANIASKR
jgi:chromosome segregation ATPase